MCLGCDSVLCVVYEVMQCSMGWTQLCRSASVLGWALPSNSIYLSSSCSRSGIRESWSYRHKLRKQITELSTKKLRNWVGKKGQQNPNERTKETFNWSPSGLGSGTLEEKSTPNSGMNLNILLAVWEANCCFSDLFQESLMRWSPGLKAMRLSMNDEQILEEPEVKTSLN